MPVDLPPDPPAIVETIDYDVYADLASDFGPKLYPHTEINNGCPSPTVRVISLGVQPEVVCKLLTGDNEVSRKPRQGTTISHVLSRFKWFGRMVLDARAAYPEGLERTGAVKIISIDPRTESLGTGWGHLVKIGADVYVATVEHVMDDSEGMYLILNDSGNVVKDGGQIVRIPTIPSDLTSDVSINLIRLAEEEVTQFLKNGGTPLQFGEYDPSIPLYVINSMSVDFRYPGSVLSVNSNTRDDGTVIFSLKDFYGKNLCVGISGSAILQYRPKENGIGVEIVIVGFASYLPPSDLDNSPLNESLHKRCSTFNTALKAPNARATYRGINISQSFRAWASATKDRTSSTRGSVRSHGLSN